MSFRLLIILCALQLSACGTKQVVDDLKLKSVERVEKTPLFAAPSYKITLTSNYSLRNSKRPFNAHVEFCDMKFEKNLRSGQPIHGVVLGGLNFQEGHRLYDRLDDSKEPLKTDKNIEYQIYINRSHPGSSESRPEAIAFDQERLPMDVCIYFSSTASYSIPNSLKTNTVRVPKTAFAPR